MKAVVAYLQSEEDVELTLKVVECDPPGADLDVCIEVTPEFLRAVELVNRDGGGKCWVRVMGERRFK